MVNVRFVTLVTRPGHLPAIAQSIGEAMARVSDVAIAWLALFDARRLRGAGEVRLPEATPCHAEGYWITPPDDWAGEPALRNAGIDLIDDDPHIAWVDDDNTVHPAFLQALADALRDDARAAVVFDQLGSRGEHRLTAAPGNMTYGAVDTAQVIAPRSLYGELRFVNRAEGTDGVTYEALYRAAPERFVFVNRGVTTWNMLRTG